MKSFLLVKFKNLEVTSSRKKNLKSNPTFKKRWLYLLQWKPFRSSENAFYFTLKARFVLKILAFLSWLGQLGHTTKSNCIKFEIVDPEIMLNFSFLEQGLGLSLHHNFRVTFQENYISCYILFTGQIWLSDCLLFLRYWTICVL